MLYFKKIRFPERKKVEEKRETSEGRQDNREEWNTSLTPYNCLFVQWRENRESVCVCGVWDSNTTNKEEKDYNDCDAFIKEQESF